MLVLRDLGVRDSFGEVRVQLLAYKVGLGNVIQNYRCMCKQATPTFGII
jgi:hypothetical protein